MSTHSKWDLAYFLWMYLIWNSARVTTWTFFTTPYPWWESLMIYTIYNSKTMICLKKCNEIAMSHFDELLQSMLKIKNCVGYKKEWTEHVCATGPWKKWNLERFRIFNFECVENLKFWRRRRKCAPCIISINKYDESDLVWQF